MIEVYIVQEKYDYHSNPEVLGVFEKAFDAIVCMTVATMTKSRTYSVHKGILNSQLKTQDANFGIMSIDELPKDARDVVDQCFRLKNEHENARAEFVAKVFEECKPVRDAALSAYYKSISDETLVDPYETLMQVGRDHLWKFGQIYDHEIEAFFCPKK
jgi:hypothetical protein